MSDRIVGYTTGVFDLFHIGHLNILMKAKEQCDHLIVGVSTDELVENYKKKTPIIPFDERIKIVESIKYVDQVVPQDDLDKIAAWHKYKYDVLFHGDDWKGTKLFNDVEEFLAKYNAKVIYLPYTKGTSSTMLAEILFKLI